MDAKTSKEATAACGKKENTGIATTKIKNTAMALISWDMRWVACSCTLEMMKEERENWEGISFLWLFPMSFLLTRTGKLINKNK